MKWYLAKIIFRIVCGKGNHTAQFDEQLRLIEADSITAAMHKATMMGKNEQESFMNNNEQIVQWQFVNVTELYPLVEMIDGTVLYSSICETDDAAAYIDVLHAKAKYVAQTSNKIYYR